MPVLGDWPGRPEQAAGWLTRLPHKVALMPDV